MSSINEKLTRLDNSSSSLKSTLNISQNAEIEAIEKKIIPDVGFVIKEYDKNGYPTEIKLIGMTNCIFILLLFITSRSTEENLLPK